MTAPPMMSRKGARPARRSATGALLLGVCATAAVMWKGHSAAFAAAPSAARAPPATTSAVSLRATSPVAQVSNPVKTVAESIADFYKAYSVPPVLPMYRTFLVDALTQTHLTVVDSRFKYDVVFALGLEETFKGLMGTYDKMMAGAPESAKIWKAYCTALGFDSAKIEADAEKARSWAKDTAPAKILAALEGSEAASDKAVAEAFAGIRSSLFSSTFSVGLFRTMEAASVEVSKANVEEWAKALTITPGKVTGDLETYKLNQNKLQKAEEMLREIEIREKKKLAQRLEEKAKALAEKAKGKASS